MDGFPSGQRGQTVNLLSTTSVVRIHPHPFEGVLAQLGEHLPYKQGVTGSSPVGPIFYRSGFADVAQLAEQLICNQQVIGSSPIIGF